MDKYEIIGGWLAFKVAAKWEVWKNIVQVPDSLGKSPIEYLKARSALGSYILTRFLVGTLANVLVGLVAAHIGRHAKDILTFVSSLGLRVAA